MYGPKKYYTQQSLLVEIKNSSRKGSPEETDMKDEIPNQIWPTINKTNRIYDVEEANGADLTLKQ